MQFRAQRAQPVAALEAQLNPQGKHSSFATIAALGTGVSEAFEALIMATLATARANASNLAST